MEKIISSKEAQEERNLENCSIGKVAGKIGVRIAYRQYPTLSYMERKYSVDSNNIEYVCCIMWGLYFILIPSKTTIL